MTTPPRLFLFALIVLGLLFLIPLIEMGSRDFFTDDANYSPIELKNSRDSTGATQRLKEELPEENRKGLSSKVSAPLSDSGFDIESGRAVQTDDSRTSVEANAQTPRIDSSLSEAYEQVPTPVADDGESFPLFWQLGSSTLTSTVGEFVQLRSSTRLVWHGARSASISTRRPVGPQNVAGIVQIANADFAKGNRIRFSGGLLVDSTNPENPASAMIWIRADDSAGQLKASASPLSE